MNFPDNRTGIAAIIGRELRLLWRNPYLLVMIVAGPLAYPFLYNTTYVKKMERDVKIVVVDDDRSASSRGFIRDLDASELISVDEVCGNVERARERIERMSAMAAVIIPEGFENHLKLGKQAPIEAIIGNVRFLVASDVSRALGDVLALRSRHASAEAFIKLGINDAAARELAEPLHPVISNTFNATESYGDFIIVGLLVIILQQTLLLGMAVSIALEREKRLLPQLFRMSKGSIPRIIIGKGALYLVLFCAHALLFYSLYYRIYRIPMTGDPWALALITVVFLASVIVWAMTLSSFFKDKVWAMISFLFTSYPFFLMSGYSWPSSAQPPVLKAISETFPITPYLRASTVITQMHGVWGDVVGDLGQSGIILLVGLVALWVRLSFLRKKNTATIAA